MERDIGAEEGARDRRVEWPTILLSLLIYGGWAALTGFHRHLPLWALIPVGGWFVAWHGSLQHETIHGHPTSNRYVNGLIGGLPLALWLPYGCYYRDHVAHHATEHVTFPLDDPESRYLGRHQGALAFLVRAMAALQAPLVGRLLLGPPLMIVAFLLAEVRRAMRAPLGVLRDWVPHLIGVALVAAWLSFCHIGLGLYLIAFVYPGTALSLLRSFAEHRAAQEPGHRVAVVEQAGIFGLLFLNNNLHAAHHRAPGLAWFRIPAFYRRHRSDILDRNGGLLYKGYGDIMRRFAFRPHDALVHPFAA